MLDDAADQSDQIAGADSATGKITFPRQRRRAEELSPGTTTDSLARREIAGRGPATGGRPATASPLRPPAPGPAAFRVWPSYIVPVPVPGTATGGVGAGPNSSFDGARLSAVATY